MIFFSSGKIFVAFFLFLFISTVLNAQTHFNFFAGPQAATVSYVVKGEKQKCTIKPGFQLGAGAKIEFDNQLFFSPSIYYSLKGYKVKLNQISNPPDPSAINNNVTVHTLETAFLLQYDFSKKPSHFFIKLGPSLDFQLSGKEKFDVVDGTYISRSMKYGFGDYGRYAISVVIHAGYEMSNSIFFFAYYEQGLTNLDNADKGPTIHSMVAGITIGKYFK